VIGSILSCVEADSNPELSPTFLQMVRESTSGAFDQPFTDGESTSVAVDSSLSLLFLTQLVDSWCN